MFCISPHSEEQTGRRSQFRTPFRSGPLTSTSALPPSGKTAQNTTRYPFSTPWSVILGGSAHVIAASSDVTETARTFWGGWLGTEDEHGRGQEELRADLRAKQEQARRFLLAGIFFFFRCFSSAEREIEFRRCKDVSSANYLLDYLCDAGLPVDKMMCLEAGAEGDYICSKCMSSKPQQMLQIEWCCITQGDVIILATNNLNQQHHNPTCDKSFSKTFISPYGDWKLLNMS